MSLIRHLRDNIKAFFGSGFDASITYDGTDMKINPKEVANGKLKILGSEVVEDGNNSLELGATTQGYGLEVLTSGGGYDGIYISTQQLTAVIGDDSFGNGALFYKDGVFVALLDGTNAIETLGIAKLGTLVINGASEFNKNAGDKDFTIYKLTSGIAYQYDASSDNHTFNSATTFTDASDVVSLIDASYGIQSDTTASGNIAGLFTDGTYEVYLGASIGPVGALVAMKDSAGIYTTLADDTYCIKLEGSSMTMQEIASAPADLTAFGQWWVKNNVPNTPMFTSDTGVDHNLLTPEGTNIKSTGEAGGTKFLREDGDGTSSWQTVSAPAPEGTAVLSTGETGGNKVLREDGDGTCSWQDMSDGWHGSQTRIKLLPTDFITTAKDKATFIESNGGSSTDEGNDVCASFAIPTGYKATHVMVYGSVANVITAYENQIDDATAVSKGAGNVNTELDITDVNSTVDNYLSIVVEEDQDDIYGGYITIATI